MIKREGRQASALRRAGYIIATRRIIGKSPSPARQSFGIASPDVSAFFIYSGHRQNYKCCDDKMKWCFAALAYINRRHRVAARGNGRVVARP